MKNFKQRWNIKSNKQIVVIMIVFAITGTTASFFSKPVLELFQITKETVSPFKYYSLYIMLIFPVYQILLIFFGFLFGQFTFFWEFEKKMLSKIGLRFLFPKKQNPE